MSDAKSVIARAVEYNVSAVYRGRISTFDATPADVTELRAEIERLREIERTTRDFVAWATAPTNGFTDPENMMVCAEWHNLRTAEAELRALPRRRPTTYPAAIAALSFLALLASAVLG